MAKRISILILAGVFCGFATRPASCTESTPYSEERAGFVLRVNGEEIPYKVFASFLLPAGQLEVEVLGAASGESFSVLLPSGQTVPFEGNFRWTAPGQPGNFTLDVTRDETQARIRLHVFVMVPADQVSEGKLNGFKIGDYPARPLKGLPAYLPPRGFVEVTPENQETLVAPHFKLKQFLCKQSGGYPKYVVLRERLLLKLEALLGHVNEAGHRADSFHVMSGYRTPFYNKAIGNVQYSRHVFDGGADIFVDQQPRDGMIDDLNRDGRIDRRDADVLRDLVEEWSREEGREQFRGGLASYKANPAHGPFVHVDVRGFSARW